MTDGSSPFACLPAELIHYILGIAASSSKHSCLDICLVSSWARHIALPNLFHTVVIHNHSQFDKYLAGPSHIPLYSDIRVAPLICNVWMEGMQAVDRDIVTVFEACDKITHLALDTYNFKNLVLSSIPVTTVGNRKRLSRHALTRPHDLHLTVLDSSRFSWILRPHFVDKSPIFDKITHIRVAAIDSYHTRESLDHFSRLSHFAVAYYDADHHKPRHLQTFLDLRSLTMLVVAIVKDAVGEGRLKKLEQWVQTVRKTDARVYLVETPSHRFVFQDEWESEMRGGGSIWDRAVQYTTEWEAQRSL